MNYLRIFQRNKTETNKLYLYIPTSLSNLYISLCFPIRLVEFSQCCLQYLLNANFICGFPSLALCLHMTNATRVLGFFPDYQPCSGLMDEVKFIPRN